MTSTWFCTTSAALVRIIVILQWERGSHVKILDYDTAMKEFSLLLANLEAAGLVTEARAGYEKTILVFVKAPKELLGNTVYKSR